MASVGNLSHAAQQDRNRIHKQLEPLVDGLAHMTQALKNSQNASNATTRDANLEALQKDVDRAADALNKSDSSSTTDATNTVDETLRQAQDALNRQNEKPSVPLEKPAQASPINIITPKVTDKSSCCC